MHACVCLVRPRKAYALVARGATSRQRPGRSTQSSDSHLKSWTLVSSHCFSFYNNNPTPRRTGTQRQSRPPKTPAPQRVPISEAMSLVDPLVAADLVHVDARGLEARDLDELLGGGVLGNLDELHGDLDALVVVHVAGLGARVVVLLDVAAAVVEDLDDGGGMLPATMRPGRALAARGMATPAAAAPAMAWRRVAPIDICGSMEAYHVRIERIEKQRIEKQGLSALAGSRSRGTENMARLQFLAAAPERSGAKDL